MARSLDLQNEDFQRKPNVPTILRPREIKGIPGVKGTLPLRAGEVILTPDEEQKLRKLGWKPGDPLPGDLPAKIAAIQKEIKKEVEETLPNVPKTFKPHIPETVDIESLSAEKRKEIESYLQEFKKVAPQIEQAIKAQSQFDALNPKVQKAIIAAEREEGIEVVDSRISTDPVTDFQHKAIDFQRKIDEAEGKIPRKQVKDLDAEKAEEAVKLPENNTGVLSLPQHCPSCNWQLDQNPAEPSYEDKISYISAVLGLKPWTKTFVLFGGRVEIAYRQLSTEYGEMVISQTAHDVRTGKFSPHEALRMASVYRSLLSLLWIKINGEKIDIAGPVDRYLTESDAPKSGTLLPNIYERMHKIEPLNNDSIWRLCRDNYERFSATQEILESRAQASDFWKLIES
jgi:hypothetical protein